MSSCAGRSRPNPTPPGTECGVVTGRRQEGRYLRDEEPVQGQSGERRVALGAQVYLDGYLISFQKDLRWLIEIWGRAWIAKSGNLFPNLSSLPLRWRKKQGTERHLGLPSYFEEVAVHERT